MSGSFYSPFSTPAMPSPAAIGGQVPEALLPSAQDRLAPNPQPNTSAPYSGLSAFDGSSPVFGSQQQTGQPQPRQLPTQPQLPPGFQPPAGQPATYAHGGVIALQDGGKIAVGPGGGLDDLIPTTIDGHRAAALSDGEFVIPADVVSMMGDGSSRAGSQRLYELIRQIRSAKTGTDEQAEPLQFSDILRRIA